MNKLILVLVFIIVGHCWNYAAVIDETIYIVSDSLGFSDGSKVPYKTFNSTPSYTETNFRIVIDQNDQLDLWVVNFDTITHEFRIKGITTTYSIPAGDSIFTSNVFTNLGLFIFHDPLGFPDNTYLGLGGMIAVKNHNHTSFYWNIKEHRDDWNFNLTSGGSVDWNTYDPNYFTINGRGAPNINLDPDARVTGNVGDTIMIYVANTGQSIHPLHFHGYHIDVVYSSKFPSHVGRSKDSEGVYPMEASIFRLVPDKPGEYPVHDHNLVATTGGGLYPFGMFLTMLIGP